MYCRELLGLRTERIESGFIIEDSFLQFDSKKGMSIFGSAQGRHNPVLQSVLYRVKMNPTFFEFFCRHKLEVLSFSKFSHKTPLTFEQS